jgi:acylphosphatase
VGFRWFAQKQAEQFGITGHVRNLPDRRVEVVAQGEKEILDAFCNTLREGPAFSKPDTLTTERISVDSEIKGFHIRF